MAEELYTFGVFTADVVRAIEMGEIGDENCVAFMEEVDVHASTATEAKKLAEEEALDLYGPGAYLFALPPGGSGGLVQIFSSN